MYRDTCKHFNISSAGQYTLVTESQHMAINPKGYTDRTFQFGLEDCGCFPDDCFKTFTLCLVSA